MRPLEDLIAWLRIIQNHNDYVEEAPCSFGHYEQEVIEDAITLLLERKESHNDSPSRITL